jgi:hypothetical protein
VLVNQLAELRLGEVERVLDTTAGTFDNARGHFALAHRVPDHGFSSAERTEEHSAATARWRLLLGHLDHAGTQDREAFGEGGFDEDRGGDAAALGLLGDTLAKGAGQ